MFKKIRANRAGYDIAQNLLEATIYQLIRNIGVQQLFINKIQKNGKGF